MWTFFTFHWSNRLIGSSPKSKWLDVCFPVMKSHDNWLECIINLLTGKEGIYNYKSYHFWIPWYNSNSFANKIEQLNIMESLILFFFSLYLPISLALTLFYLRNLNAYSLLSSLYVLQYSEIHACLLLLVKLTLCSNNWNVIYKPISESVREQLIHHTYRMSMW